MSDELDELLLSAVRWLREHRDRIQATEPRSADPQWLAWWRPGRLAVRSVELRAALLAAHPELGDDRAVGRRLCARGPSGRRAWLRWNAIKGGMVHPLAIGSRNQVQLQVYELRVEALEAAGLEVPSRARLLAAA